MRRRLLAIVVAVCCTALVPAHGQTSAVASANVNVRTGQSTSSRIRDVLTPGDTVTLLSLTLRKGYYHIQERSGIKGWTYKRYLRLITAAPSPTIAPTAAPSNTVDSTLQKPEPQVALFHRAGFPDCAGVGEPGDTLTDLRKNRTDEPTSYQPITFDAILDLPYPKNHKTHRTTWPQTDLDVIAPYEGIAVTVTAFIARQNGIIVQNSSHSSGEATNCHALDNAGVDWHVTLVRQPGDAKSTGIVVETTPRVRANGHAWTPDMLRPHIVAGDSVRVSGWLLYDPEHFAQTTNYDPAHPSGGIKVRATLWEIHPVTRLEVFDSATGQWKSLP